MSIVLDIRLQCLLSATKLNVHTWANGSPVNSMNHARRNAKHVPGNRQPGVSGGHRLLDKALCTAPPTQKGSAEALCTAPARQQAAAEAGCNGLRCLDRCSCNLQFPLYWQYCIGFFSGAKPSATFRAWVLCIVARMVHTIHRTSVCPCVHV